MEATMQTENNNNKQQSTEEKQQQGIEDQKVQDNIATQEHQKILVEFEKQNEEIYNLNNEKQFLKAKINEILQKAGFDIDINTDNGKQDQMVSKYREEDKNQDSEQQNQLEGMEQEGDDDQDQDEE